MSYLRLLLPLKGTNNCDTMNNVNLTVGDKELLSRKFISEENLQEQLERFERGFPFLDVIAPASIEKGIKAISENDQGMYLEEWNSFLLSSKKVQKFVPASGAASRMFKDLFAFLDSPYNEPSNEFEKKFFEDIAKFAFYESLDAVCKKNEGENIESLIQKGYYKAILTNLLQEQGLNYGNLPKGLLEFHRYELSSRCPIEEHLMEGYLYAKNATNEINIHFTVSSEHRSLFEELVTEKVPDLELEYGVEYNITFSEQKAATDTIAVDAENKPFRDNGEILFRPGGHGALIENLDDLDADVIFIKNIDNVVPDRYKPTETKYKKLLAGVLINTQNQIFKYQRIIDEGKYSHELLIEILYFLQNELNIKNPDTKNLEDAELVMYLRRKLDRPCRVCGMVKNIGEPGGGPFLAVNSDGTISLQILESSQIDMNDFAKKQMFMNGTHFNPVDIVCGVRDYKGNKYNLKKFIDQDTGFISFKSKNGRELKALELPGLWNGAMSDWNTIFVEVPIETFNPVKTVNDLLREHHL